MMTCTPLRSDSSHCSTSGWAVQHLLVRGGDEVCVRANVGLNNELALRGFVALGLAHVDEAWGRGGWCEGIGGGEIIARSARVGGCAYGGVYGLERRG